MSKVDHKNILSQFPQTLAANSKKLYLKKEEYLNSVMSVFNQFVRKSSRAIDSIIEHKIEKLSLNYSKLSTYLDLHKDISKEEEALIVTQFLVNPFYRFPFVGNKNEKLLQQQNSLIQKTAILIEQTLIDSFNEDEIPNFDSPGFFATIKNKGIGKQSLVKLQLCPQNLQIEPKLEIVPCQRNIKSLNVINQSQLILVGDSSIIEIWDLQLLVCLKKIYLEIISEVSCLTIAKQNHPQTSLQTCFLILGFSDNQPDIWSYRCDTFTPAAHNVVHTRQISKLVMLPYRSQQGSGQYLLSGSLDGTVCIHNFSSLKTLNRSSYISPVEEIIVQDPHVYVLLKSSMICEYSLNNAGQNPMLHFVRTISTGYVSMLRFAQLTSNFRAIACSIYGLSQVQITSKFRLVETKIINIPEMIADFIVIESKLGADYYAVCSFQNSAAIRIYRMSSEELVYELESDYSGDAGVAGYMPRMDIAYVGGHYVLVIVSQAEFAGDANKIKMYRLIM